MKKLFEVTPDEMEALNVREESYNQFLGAKYGFKPETIEFTGGGTNQFFAEKAVKELEPVVLGAEMNAETFTLTQLAKFSYSVADLQKKADDYSKLKVNGVDDKEGLKILTRARIELKGDVTGIRKAGKQLREFSNSYNKAIIAREDELASIIEPVRDALQKRENEIEEEKERIKAEADRLEDLRISEMLSKLAAVGHAADYGLIKGITDEGFEELLTEAINIHNEKVKRDQEEADRLKLEKEKAERERKEELERLEKQRKQQDEENKNIALQQAQIREQQEAIRREKEAIEAEKQKLADSIQREKQRKEDEIRIAREKQEAIEKALKDKELEEQRLKLIEADRLRIEKELADERAASASDHDKLEALALSIDSFVLPELTSKNGKAIVKVVDTKLGHIADHIRKNMFNEGKDVL